MIFHTSRWGMTHLLLYHHDPPDIHPSALQTIPDPNPIFPYTPIHNYIAAGPSHSVRLICAFPACPARELRGRDGLSWSDDMGEMEEFVDI